MKNIQQLFEKMAKDTVERIEISQQFICASTATPSLNEKYNEIRKSIAVGTNHLISMSADSSESTNNAEINYFDLAGNKTETKRFTIPKDLLLLDYVVLDNPEAQYLAMILGNKNGNGGKLLVLNTQNLQIVFTSAAIQLAKGESFKLRKNNGQLYGLTLGTFGHNFYTAPSEFKEPFPVHIIKLSRHFVGGDVVFDKRGNNYFLGNCTSTSWGHFSDSSSYFSHGTPLIGGWPNNVSYEMELLQNKAGFSSLIYWHNHKSEICILKNANDGSGLPTAVGHKVHFDKERVYNVKALSSENKKIIVVTEKASYIYDLENQVKLAKFNHRAGANPSYISPVVGGDDTILSTHFERRGAKSARTSLLTVHQMQEPNELIKVFDQILSNHSVKELVIHDMDFELSIVLKLYELSKKRQDLQLILPDKLKGMLDHLKAQEAKEGAFLAQIRGLEQAQQGQQTSIGQLRASITELEKQRQKDSELFAQEKQELGLKLAAQTTLNETAIASMGQKLIEQEQEFTGKEQAFLEKEQALRDEYQKDIEAMQEEMRATSLRYEELFLQLSTSSMPTQSLVEQINNADELDEQLLQELVDPKHNITGLSLIRWAEQEELQPIKEDLIQRGAIFHAADLVDKIEQIHPPFNEKHRLDALTLAIEKLLLAYKNKLLPQSEVNTMVDLIRPEIQQEIAGHLWLQELYVPETESIKNNLVENYFSSQASDTDVSVVENEYLKAVDELSNNSKFKHHHNRLKNTRLLSTFREAENKSDPLLILIKAKMDISNIDLTEEQEIMALQAILAKPTEELGDLIDLKVIQYWEKKKELLNPQLVKIEQLENKIKALEQRARVTDVPTTLFSQHKAAAQVLPLRRSNSCPEFGL